MPLEQAWMRAEPPENCRVAPMLARRIREARASISYRWLDRVAERVTVDRDDVFPTEELLNHVPLLIDAIAEYLEKPTEEGTAADHVIGKATELGELRYRQGFAPYQILKEFEILGGLILSFITKAVRDVGPEVPPDELIVCVHRVHQALSKVMQATAARYLALADRRTSDREQRLRTFNAVLSGELSTRIRNAKALARGRRGPTTGGGEVDGALAAGAGDAGDGNADDADGDLTDATGGASAEDLVSELEILEAQVDQLIELSDAGESSRQQRNVGLRGAALEAVRRVRQIAEGRGVELRVAEPLPEVEVNGAAVELCLVAYLTNAIRYADATLGEPWVEVRASLRPEEEQLVVEVRDNGRSPAEPDVTERFRRYLSGQRTVPEEGYAGLGLGFVHETVAWLGGRAWCENADVGPGSVFAFSLPSRRLEDG